MDQLLHPPILLVRYLSMHIDTFLPSILFLGQQSWLAKTDACTSSNAAMAFLAHIQVFCCELQHTIVCRRQGFKKNWTKKWPICSHWQNSQEKARKKKGNVEKNSKCTISPFIMFLNPFAWLFSWFLFFPPALLCCCCLSPACTFSRLYNASS